MRVLLIYSLVILVMHYKVLCQEVNECRRLLTQLNKPAKQDSVSVGKTYFMDYGIKVTEKKKAQAPQESRIKMYGDKYHRHVIMDQVAFYIDTVYSISLIKATNTIMINKVDTQTTASIKQFSSTVADSMLSSNYEVIACNTITGKIEYDKVIDVKINNPLSKVGRATYFVQASKGNIYKMIIYPRESNAAVTTEYTFYTTNYNYTERQVNKPVYDLFFKKDGSLQASFKGYRVIDNRSKK